MVKDNTTDDSGSKFVEDDSEIVEKQEQKGSQIKKKY